MANEVAPEGHVFVCTACGKTSPDRYGDDPLTMKGWDVSCMLNARLCKEDDCERDPETDRVTRVFE
jgi:hypothetical protein